MLSAFWFGSAFHWLLLLLILMPENVVTFVGEDRKGTFLGLLAGIGAVMALVLPPLRIWRTSCAAAARSWWWANGSTSVTSSSNATTATRSCGPTLCSTLATASSTARSGAPDMEPERSITSTTSMGARSAGVASGAWMSIMTWMTSSTCSARPSPLSTRSTRKTYSGLLARNHSFTAD